MWILPKQLHTSAFVADTKALGLDSEEFSQICEKSLTWRGKDSLSRTWLQRWKRENWMQHLCSRTLKPSLTESFVDAWISSQEASLVSHSRLLESVKQLKTPDTSFPTSEMESENANLELFSSKTWKELSPQKQQTENQFSSMSSESWKAWVTEQRQEYSQRVKSAHLIRENESSSLELGTNWATPQTFDSNNIVRTPEKLAQTRAEKNAGCMNLREQVHYPDMNHSRKAAKNWPTATARDWKGCGNAITRKDGKHRRDNLEAVIKYGHPDRANPNTNGKSRGSLNPNWVEHLMGLPVGWTDLGSWATESSPKPPQ